MEKEGEVTLRFPDVEALSPPILQLNEVSFSYTGGSDNLIFSGVNLTASLQSRICIVGENGAGKTTLLKIITSSLSPTKGTVHVHRNLKFGYFSQHHVDQLDMRVCPVELLQNHFPGTNESKEFARDSTRANTLKTFSLFGRQTHRRI